MKKKRFLLPVLCLLIPLALMVSALAAGGDLSDPLASLSYLTGIFTDTVDKRVDEKLNASDQALLSGNLEAVSGSSTATWTETRLKEGDVLTGSTGTSVLVLAGGARVTFSGAVVDVTTGTAVTSGSALAVNHRYLVAENTTADFTVTSKTAVVDYQGGCSLTESATPDYNAMAESMGMTNDIANYDPTATCTQANLASMKQSADLLYEALHGDTLEPLVLNGMAQPIFPYTTGAVTEGYDNANSDIIRYCVYVETNYDTDDDGKLDLVKALVQLPRAAMEGDYQAATIYEARPYITGCTSGATPYGDGDYDLSKLYSQPDPRVPAGNATTVDAAAAAQSYDWYY